MTDQDKNEKETTCKHEWVDDVFDEKTLTVSKRCMFCSIPKDTEESDDESSDD